LRRVKRRLCRTSTKRACKIVRRRYAIGAVEHLGEAVKRRHLPPPDIGTKE
jgi:hypothetical protein